MQTQLKSCIVYNPRLCVVYNGSLHGIHYASQESRNTWRRSSHRNNLRNRWTSPTLTPPPNITGSKKWQIESFTSKDRNTQNLMVCAPLYSRLGCFLSSIFGFGSINLKGNKNPPCNSCFMWHRVAELYHPSLVGRYQVYL